jgi:hypothetical protein
MLSKFKCNKIGRELSKDELTLNLPTAEEIIPEHSRLLISWWDFMEETAERTRLYMSEYDDRDHRSRSRNPEPFVLD